MYVTKNLCDEKEAHTTQLKKKTAIDLIIHTSHVLWFTRLLCPRNSPGKNTGVGSHSLLQGIFPTQGSNLGLLHCRQTPYHLTTREAQYYMYLNDRVSTVFWWVWERAVKTGCKISGLRNWKR